MTAHDTPRVRLRDLRAEDLPRLHAWYQTPDLWDHLVGDFTPRGEAEAVAYMARWLAPSDTELRLGIEVEDGQGPRLVGLAFFAPLNLGEGWAELHTMIGDAGERGRGVGRLAVAALLERGFALGLARIELKVLETNGAARRVYEQCGFRVIGRAAPATKRGGSAEVLVMQADQPRSATT
jgi:RimJ/RimL family protein N-acetyltransferase